MSKKPLSPSARRARDRAIYALFLRGRPPEAICCELGTSRQAVQKAIQAGQKAARERFAEAAVVRIAQSELLEFIVRELLDAWEESKKGQEVTKVSSGGAGEGEKRKAEKTTRKHPGDPRYLAGAMSALADLRRLWRLEAPAAGPSQGEEHVSVEEDIRWYDNNAHDLAAQAASASTPDFAVSCTVQGRGLR